MTATASVRIAHQDQRGRIMGSYRPIVIHFKTMTARVSARQMAQEATANSQTTEKYLPSSRLPLNRSTAQVPKVMNSMVGSEIVTASKQARANFFQRGAS